MQLTSRLPLMVFGVALLVPLGVTSITPILPLVAETFEVSLSASSLLITFFALPGLLLTPLLGIWADRYGRKALLLPALVLFCLAGILCAFATSFKMLLLFRTLQGLGAAPFGLLYSTVIADSWQKEERARMMSYAATVLGLGTGLSPALGGALAMLDWRLPFLIPLFALPVLFLAWKSPLLKPAQATNFKEYLRLTLACVNLPRTKKLLLLSLFGSIMLFGPIIACLPLHADKVFKASSMIIGLLLAGASVCSGIMASQMPFFYSKFSTSRILYAGQFFYISCFLALPFVGNLYLLFFCVMLYGIGQGMAMPVMGTLLAGQAPDEQRAALLSINSFFLRASQAFAPAFFAFIAGQSTPAMAISLGSVVSVFTIITIYKTDLPSVTENSFAKQA